MVSKAGKNSSIISAKILKILDLQSDRIRCIWHENLNHKCGIEGDLEVSLLFGTDEDQKDLLSILLEILTGKIEIEGKHLHTILNRVRAGEYSVSDFFLELSTLQESIGETLKSSTDLTETELLEGLKIVGEYLSNLFLSVLRMSWEIHEYIINASRGFCQIDAEGMIIYANTEMKRILGREAVVGSLFESFFKGVERDFVRDILSARPGTEPTLRQLDVIAGSNLRTVLAEIGRLIIGEENLGGYASLLDYSGGPERAVRIYDNLPGGIARIDVNGQFTYANPKALEIFGIDSWDGLNVKDLVTDLASYEVLADSLKSRRKGQLYQYEIKITRISDGKEIPVTISSLAETDLKGMIIGTFVMIQSRVIENTVEMIQDIIGRCRNAQVILKEVATVIRNTIHFDLFTAWVYSTDMQYRRPLMCYSSSKTIKWPKRWMEMPKHKHIADWWNLDRRVICKNLESLVTDSKWLKQEPDIQILLKDGFYSFVRYPIIKQGKVIATISLSSKRESAFSDKDVELLDSLGSTLHSAVLRALDYGLDSIVKVFISYEKEDAQFAKRLADDLRERDAQVWIAPDSVLPGESWVEAINRGIEESRYMLVVLTPAAAKSQWVRHETNTAISLEREGRMKVIPLDVKSCKTPALWSGYQMISFRQNYDVGFHKLAKRLGLYA